MKRGVPVVLAAALLAGCAVAPPVPPPSAGIHPFSANQPGVELPRGWSPWIITRAKAPTRYELVVDPSTRRIVLHAVAERSATGLKQRLDVDPATRPVVQWDWRIVAPLASAELSDRHADDSPARLLLFFDGDKSTLPPRDQARMELARVLTGQPIPFATLMYVWDNHRPEGTVIPNAAFGQIKMVVAGSGSERLGQWKRFSRNYAQDYRRAFGAPPGRLVGVGVLTDTDNTESAVEAYYGDIRLQPQL